MINAGIIPHLLLDWGISLHGVLRITNPQEKREFLGIAREITSRQQHEDASTIRFYVSAATAGTNPMPVIAAPGARV